MRACFYYQGRPSVNDDLIGDDLRLQTRGTTLAIAENRSAESNCPAVIPVDNEKAIERM